MSQDNWPPQPSPPQAPTRSPSGYPWAQAPGQTGWGPTLPPPDSPSPGSLPPGSAVLGQRPGRRQRAVLAAVITTASVLVLVVVGGWAWPGWWTSSGSAASPSGGIGFLADPPPAPTSDTAVPGTNPAPPPAAPRSAPPQNPPQNPAQPQTGQPLTVDPQARATVDAVVAKLNAKDLDGVTALTCAVGRKPGPDNVPLVKRTIMTDVPSLDPARSDLAGVTTRFRVSELKPNPDPSHTGPAAIVEIAFDAVPPSAARDPKLTPHTGAMLFTQERGTWVTCGLALDPGPDEATPTGSGTR